MTNNATPETKNTKSRRRLTGVVVSHTPKTAVVLVAREKMHPVYKKSFRVTTKYHAHDEGNTAAVGATVTIEAARPMSARKRWRII